MKMWMSVYSFCFQLINVSITTTTTTNEDLDSGGLPFHITSFIWFHNLFAFFGCLVFDRVNVFLKPEPLPLSVYLNIPVWSLIFTWTFHSATPFLLWKQTSLNLNLPVYKIVLSNISRLFDLQFVFHLLSLLFSKLEFFTYDYFYCSY